MTTASETTTQTSGPVPLVPCGTCTYTLNTTDGCYHRQNPGCNGTCKCAALICGFSSEVLQLLRPKPASSAATVSFSCAQVATEEEWVAATVLQEVARAAAERAFWKRAAMGIGVPSALLATGLVLAFTLR